jgi:hypothetical protein
MTPYEFSILRYTHDPVTREFINVGIVLHSASAGFLEARLNMNYGRATKFFGHVDGSRYRFVLRHVQDTIEKFSRDLLQPSLFGESSSLERFLNRILPVDDSSLQFAAGGAGLSDDLRVTLDKLYRRYVITGEVSQSECKTRDDVWRIFRKPMDRLAISDKLHPKRISAKDYQYEFQHAWKNGIWNVCEPVSFDLLDEDAIREKANKWLGRGTCLRDGVEPFKLTFLLGAPQLIRLQGVFQHAENILNKIPGKKELIREEEAEKFAEELKGQLERAQQ